VLHPSGSASPYHSTPLATALRLIDNASLVSGRVLINQAHIKTAWGSATIILSHWSNFLLSDRWVSGWGHFVLAAENTAVVRPGFEAYIRKAQLLDLERFFRVAVAPHRNANEAEKVKECAMNDKDWRKLALNEYSPDSRAAKGMCECSFYPRDVLRGYLCALGHRGFERHARDATRPPRGACFPEEHWHPTWVLNHVDWPRWRAFAARELHGENATGEPRPSELTDAALPPVAGRVVQFSPDMQQLADQVRNILSHDDHSGEARNWTKQEMLRRRLDALRTYLETRPNDYRGVDVRACSEELIQQKAQNAFSVGEIEDGLHRCYLARIAKSTATDGVFCLKDATVTRRLGTLDRSLHVLESFLNPGNRLAEPTSSPATGPQMFWERTHVRR